MSHLHAHPAFTAPLGARATFTRLPLKIDSCVGEYIDSCPIRYQTNLKAAEALALARGAVTNPCRGALGLIVCAKQCATANSTTVTTPCRCEALVSNSYLSKLRGNFPNDTPKGQTRPEQSMGKLLTPPMSAMSLGEPKPSSHVHFPAAYQTRYQRNNSQ